MRDFEEIHVEIRRLVGRGDTVLAEVRYCVTAKHTGAWIDLQVCAGDGRHADGVKLSRSGPA